MYSIYGYYKILAIFHVLYTASSVYFNTFTMLFNHHFYLIPKHYDPKENPIAIKQSLSNSLPAPGNHQSVFCLSELAYSGYFNMGPLVSGFFHLA